MKQFKISDNIVITSKSKPFVIAEIGSNHNGSVEKCKHLIKLAKQCGCDAVKLQKKNIDKVYTKKMLNSPYDNENSFGKTYGEHKQALEFNKEQFIELKEFADSWGLLFFATPFDEDSTNTLEEIGVPMYKVQSGDFRNLSLIKYIISKNKPIILSTGGCRQSDIIRTVKLLKDSHAEFALLHCVTTYPNKVEELNLKAIETLNYIYGNNIIGLSSHYNGILDAIIAYHYGARIIEKHFTDSRANKGTDHKYSLEPSGMAKMVSYLNKIPNMNGNGIKHIIDAEKPGLCKLGKAPYVTKTIPKGYKLRKEDVILKIPAEPDCIDDIEYYEDLEGCITLRECSTAETLKMDYIEGLEERKCKKNE